MGKGDNEKVEQQEEQVKEETKVEEKVEMEEVDLGLSKHVVELETCGALDVYIQGDLENGKNGDSVFLTIHGLGNSYKTWVNFMNHEDMVNTRDRSLVVHVSLPGQEENAEDLSGDFPDLANLGMNLVTVLDQLRINRVVVMGEGAGANIAARFAINHPTRVNGLLLVNCKHAEASLPSKFKVMRQSKYGGNKLNVKNIAKFEDSYKKRDEIMSQMCSKIKTDTLVVCGANNEQLVRAAEEIHSSLPTGMCSIIKMEDVTNVMLEAMEMLADSFILFVQGLGLVPSVQRKISRSMSMTGDNEENSLAKPRKISMEMFDVPNIRRLSLSSHNI